MKTVGNAGGEQLGYWLRMNGISDRAFDRLIEAGSGSTSRWVKGLVKPGVVYANRVAEFTGGEIPTSIWSSGDPWMEARR